jgi:hypothetical protein
MPRPMDGQRQRLLRSLAAAASATCRARPRRPAPAPGPPRRPPPPPPTRAPASKEAAGEVITSAAQASLFATRRAADPEAELTTVADAVRPLRRVQAGEHAHERRAGRGRPARARRPSSARDPAPRRTARAAPSSAAPASSSTTSSPRA